MYIRVKSTKNSPRKSVQIVKSVRSGKRVAQSIVQHVGIARDEEHLEELKQLARKLLAELEELEKPSLPGLAPEEDSPEWERPIDDNLMVRLKSMLNLEQAIEGPLEVVESLFASLGFDGIFGVSSRGRGSSNVLKKCLACALANPSSKRGMHLWLGSESLCDLQLNRIYRMMDSLSERTEKVKRLVARETISLPGASTALMLFDVTTLYFESFQPDDLRKPGYSKDNKFKETQVVLALAVTPDGFPLWYEIFPGNTYEGHTLLPVLKRCAEEFAAKDVVVVADRAMFTEENLRALEDAGYSFVVSAKLRTLKKTVKKKILNAENYVPLPERNVLEASFGGEEARESDGSGTRTAPMTKTPAKKAAKKAKSGDSVDPVQSDDSAASDVLADSAGSPVAMRSPSGESEDSGEDGGTEKAERKPFTVPCWYAFPAPAKKTGASGRGKGIKREEGKDEIDEIKDEIKEDAAKERKKEAPPLDAPPEEKERKRTVVATWSLKRARKDAFDREKLLVRLREKLAVDGGLKGKNLVSNRGTGKYLSVRDGEESDVYVVDQEKIEKDREWDGIHGVITNLKVEGTRDVERLLDHYCSLWRIEESFRLQKHDLSIRPVYHWAERRIRAHIAMCYLAFAMLRHVQHRVSLRQNTFLSAGEIRRALKSVQATIMKDRDTGKLYRFPQAMKSDAKKIYRSLGIRRESENTEMLSMRKYRARKLTLMETEVEPSPPPPESEE